jgi:hypothetical protein
MRAYNKSVEQGKGEDFLNQFRAALKDTALYKNFANNVDKYITKAAFVDSATLNKHVGVLNFIVYHKEEGFELFLVHDYGAGGGNTGTYVLAGGGVDEMAETLLKNKNITFEPIGPKNVKPRIRLVS